MGRHGLVKDAETDYYLDENGRRVYFQKFLRPDFLPKLSEPIDPIELAYSKKTELQNNSAFNFSPIQPQVNPQVVKSRIQVDQGGLNELYLDMKDGNNIDFSHLEPYLDEQTLKLSHRTKKNVYFQLGDDYEANQKVREEEILEHDVDTEVGAALATCLHGLGNKIIMSRDMLSAHDQNPDEKFVKFNNFLYI